MAVLTLRVVSVCQLCGEVKLEGEPSMHRRREAGGLCPSSDSGRRLWRRVQAVVLEQSRLHAEMLWLIE